MYNFKVTKSSGQQVDVLATKSNIQNGDLILLDLNNQVVGAFAKSFWTDCTRTKTPECSPAQS